MEELAYKLNLVIWLLRGLLAFAVLGTVCAVYFFFRARHELVDIATAIILDKKFSQNK